MTTRRLALSVLFILSGFVAGLVVTGRMRTGEETVAQTAGAQTAVSPAAAAQTPSGVPRLPSLASLPDFSSVASTTVPAVANISSLQVVRRSNSPFADDPFFQYFFGDQGDLFGSQRGVESSLGSGVVVSHDGYVLTNYHVIAGESGRLSVRDLPEITVALADKRALKAQIVGVDPATDLALLKVNATGLPTMPWGDSARLKVAEWVLAIGNPFQLDQSVTLGIVSAIGRRVGISAYEDFIQTDAAINPGNSGGALVNVRGELVGINTAIFSRSGGYQGIGFAVPSNLARRVINDLLTHGEVRRGSLGYIEFSPLTTQMAERLGVPGATGVLVQRMMRNSPSHRAGLLPGDVIVAFNKTKIDDVPQLQRLIQDAPIGGSITLRVVRDGRSLDLTIPVQSTSSR